MDGSTMELGVFKYTSEEEERILGGIQGEACFLKTPSILELKRKYESDVKRTINLELHMMTLGQYYKEGKIPRGLRSTIRPNLFQGNAAYCTRFVIISNKYAMDTILLNIDFLQTEIKKLQLNTGDLENKIRVLIPVEEWNVFKEKVDKEGTKLRNDLEEIKRRKWNRDLEDYETGQIYAWQKENNKPAWKKKGGLWKNQQCGDNNNLTNNDIIPHRPGHYYGETNQAQEERRQAAPSVPKKDQKRTEHSPRDK
ncbi:unnamed protein product [Ranitomeya imitator]|uniref:Uncharacterized protein n=1 Tax=Ranitomeya imitator TaxID=111125 RepID=A0ABN9KS20_9NEOB|nr:unnamed protein product [Ranitomeya imitator]